MKKDLLLKYCFDFCGWCACSRILAHLTGYRIQAEADGQNKNKIREMTLKLLIQNEQDLKKGLAVLRGEATPPDDGVLQLWANNL